MNFTPEQRTRLRQVACGQWMLLDDLDELSARADALVVSRDTVQAAYDKLRSERDELRAILDSMNQAKCDKIGVM